MIVHPCLIFRGEGKALHFFLKLMMNEEKINDEKNHNFASLVNQNVLFWFIKEMQSFPFSGKNMGGMPDHSKLLLGFYLYKAQYKSVKYPFKSLLNRLWDVSKVGGHCVKWGRFLCSLCLRDLKMRIDTEVIPNDSWRHTSHPCRLKWCVVVIMSVCLATAGCVWERSLLTGSPARQRGQQLAVNCVWNRASR